MLHDLIHTLPLFIKPDIPMDMYTSLAFIHTACCKLTDLWMLLTIFSHLYHVHLNPVSFLAESHQSNKLHVLNKNRKKPPTKTDYHKQPIFLCYPLSNFH